MAKSRPCVRGSADITEFVILIPLEPVWATLISQINTDDSAPFTRHVRDSFNWHDCHVSTHLLPALFIESQTYYQ